MISWLKHLNLAQVGLNIRHIHHTICMGTTSFNARLVLTNRFLDLGVPSQRPTCDVHRQQSLSVVDNIMHGDKSFQSCFNCHPVFAAQKVNEPWPLSGTSQVSLVTARKHHLPSAIRLCNLFPGQRIWARPSVRGLVALNPPFSQSVGYEQRHQTTTML